MSSRNNGARRRSVNLTQRRSDAGGTVEDSFHRHRCDENAFERLALRSSRIKIGASARANVITAELPILRLTRRLSTRIRE
jgi:hypothetical protein